MKKMKKVLIFMIACLLVPVSGLCQQKAGSPSKGLLFSQKAQLIPKVWNAMSEQQQKALERNEKLSIDPSSNRIVSRSFETKEKMDSSISQVFTPRLGALINNQKKETLFDERGNVIDDANFLWEPDQEQWIGNNRNTFSYSSENRLDFENLYLWDNPSRTWGASQRFEYSYDGPENRYSGFTSYTIEGLFQELQPNERTDILFDENGQAIVQDLYLYNDSLEEFMLDSKIETEYGENGEILSSVLSLADGFGEGLVPEFLFQEEYDERGNNTTSIISEWDATSSEWLPVALTLMEYDELDRPILFVNTFFDASTQNFEPFYTESTTYNQEGRRDFVVTGALNFATREFETTGQNRFSYDENENLIEFATDSYDQTTDTFMLTSWEIYSYDTTLATSEVLATNFSLPELPVNKYLGSQSFTIEDTTASQTEAFDVFYSPLVSTNVSPELANIIRVFPNPTHGTLNLDIPKHLSYISFELMDLQGRRIFVKDLAVSQQLQLNTITTGVYLYRLHHKEGTQQGKLMITQ